MPRGGRHRTLRGSHGRQGVAAQHDSHGHHTNAFTSNDLTAYHLSITSDDLERVIDIESDRFQNLSYSEEVFKTEAGAVYGEYRKNRMNPIFAVLEALYAEAFDVHTYSHLAMGYEEDIKAMPGMFDYSRSFFSRYYRPENVVLFVAGDIEVEPTMNLIRKYYSSWKPGYIVPKIKPEPQQKGERRIEVDYEGRSLPIVWVAYKVDAFDPSNMAYVAADLLAELAFGETSELYKMLVIDEQVVEFLGIARFLERPFGDVAHRGDVADEGKSIAENPLAAAAPHQMLDEQYLLALEPRRVHVGDVVRYDVHLPAQRTLPG